MKYFKLMILAMFFIASAATAAPNFTSTSGASSTAAAGSSSGSVAISGGGGGGGGGTGAANFSVDPQVTITSTGSDLGKSVPNMIAPALTTTLTETCLGSASGAVSAAGFGGTFGKTFRDDDCIARLNARELRSMGLTAEAMEVLCSRPTIYAAMKRISLRKNTLSVCSGQDPTVSSYDPNALSAELTASGGYDPADDVYIDGKIVARWTYDARDRDVEENED